jgi:uncharacterized membrane protein
LVPAASMLAAIGLLGREEQRMRKWEPRMGGAPLSPSYIGGMAAVIIFAWLNLTIIDWFSVGRMLEVTFERLPARDLTMSIAWAVYALTLLAIGMARKKSGPRRASLALLMITCAKVFLHDLSHLEDLHRVMSLVGLALSLIIVSFAYQRFVFRNADGETS